MAADLNDARTVSTVRDSFYINSSIYTIDVSQEPAIINDEMLMLNSNGALAAVAPDQVNSDDTVNLDVEGIAVRADGGFWIASEGAGSVDDPSRPVKTLNLLVRTDDVGAIEEVVKLPDTVNARQRRFGFGGVTSVGSGADEVVYVAFQREWVGDPAGNVRI